MSDMPSSVKENKSLRLEVHHAKAFDDICNENSVSTVEQALTCKELWDLSMHFRCAMDAINI
jgi:hypothetical protein